MCARLSGACVKHEDTSRRLEARPFSPNASVDYCAARRSTPTGCPGGWVADVYCGVYEAQEGLLCAESV